MLRHIKQYKFVRYINRINKLNGIRIKHNTK